VLYPRLFDSLNEISKTRFERYKFQQYLFSNLEMGFKRCGLGSIDIYLLVILSIVTYGLI
jgi:hypothetical protein